MPEDFRVAVLFVGTIFLLSSIVSGRLRAMSFDVPVIQGGCFRFVAFVLGVILIVSAMGLYLFDAALDFEATYPNTTTEWGSETFVQGQTSTAGYGNSCCDMLGTPRCTLSQPAPLNSGCFCPFQGTGYTC
jgi:hypothetical protein